MATKKIQVPMYESEFDSSFQSVRCEEVDARDATHRAGPILEQYLKDIRKFRTMSSSALPYTRTFEFLEWYHMQLITGNPSMFDALAEAVNSFRTGENLPTVHVAKAKTPLDLDVDE